MLHILCFQFAQFKIFNRRKLGALTICHTTASKSATVMSQFTRVATALCTIQVPLRGAFAADLEG